MMLQPPLTYILGYILEGNQVTGYRLGLEIGGGLIIFVGLVLTISKASLRASSISAISQSIIISKAQSKQAILSQKATLNKSNSSFVKFSPPFPF